MGFEQSLRNYADLAVKVAVNLQPGQRLLIADPFFNLGVPLQTAPLIRQIAASAYQAGARFVDVMWADEQLHLTRLQHASPDTLNAYPDWQAQGIEDYASAGDSILIVLANDPDLFAGQDPARVAVLQQIAWQRVQPFMDYVARNAINSAVIAAATPGWAAKVFPELPREAQEARLWEALFTICRVTEADPIAAWHAHIAALSARGAYLTLKRYTALRFTGPGTDLRVGLPSGHSWWHAHRTSKAGIPFTANVPTEEIGTIPHKDQVDGVVTLTKPLSLGGALVDGVSLTFVRGQVVDVKAATGEAILRTLIATDPGASRLGEVALVPHSSPIAQSGWLFYNILIDENAANHIALGQAYRFSLPGGETMSDEDFAAAGGNQSAIHVDVMIGSAEMDVDGLREDGSAEPVMRAGEWAFAV